MKKYKSQLKALVKISEKVLLLIVGVAAIALGFRPRFENMQIVIWVIGLLCVTVSLLPMMWEYAKASWPKQ